MRIAAALFMLLSALPGGAAAQERRVAIGQTIDWPLGKAGEVTRYRAGPVSLALTAEADETMSEIVRPILTVTMPGYAPARVEGAETGMRIGPQIIVGRWDAERPYVLFQSFTGGAHCCNLIRIILPEAGRLQIVDFGVWDGDYLEELPGDVDGDGRIDFVFRDNRFLYAFAAYAGSHAPTQIWNAEGGRAVDVSAAPRYRSLFVREMNEFREICLEGGGENNSPCAAYVAAAALVGQFDRAWREMLGVYDRNSQWSLPRGCRIEVPFGACPQSEWIEFTDFPTALHDFLTRAGYLPR